MSNWSVCDPFQRERTTGPARSAACAIVLDHQKPYESHTKKNEIARSVLAERGCARATFKLLNV